LPDDPALPIKAAPIKIEYIPGTPAQQGVRGRNPGAAPRPPQLRMTYVSLSPGETTTLVDMVLMLQPRCSNAVFWQKLKEMQLCHNLHNRDVAGMIRIKMPGTYWGRLQAAHKDGNWCADLGTDAQGQEQDFEGFRADVTSALGQIPINWNAIMGVTQNKGEGAQEYGNMNFEAFRAHSGVPNADRQYSAFIQMYRDRLSPAH